MDDDFELFFKTHERRIHFQINRLNFPRSLYEELYAEGVLALWQAYKGYDSSRGNLGTYLNYTIRFRLIDYVRKKIREQTGDEQAYHEAIIQLDDGNRDVETGVPILNASSFTLPLANDDFWTEVKSHLSDNQWKWVKYFVIANLTIKEIMEIEEVSASAVKSWGREVRRKLRDEEVREKLEELAY